MNLLIICVTILLIVIVVSITTYHIKFLSNPELPKRLLWMNCDITEIKGHIKSIYSSLERIDKDIKNIKD